MIPKRATIKICHTINLDDILDSLYREYLQREGFSDKEIENNIEEIIRDNIWQYIPENKIFIKFE